MTTMASAPPSGSAPPPPGPPEHRRFWMTLAVSVVGVAIAGAAVVVEAIGASEDRSKPPVAESQPLPAPDVSVPDVPLPSVVTERLDVPDAPDGVSVTAYLGSVEAVDATYEHVPFGWLEGLKRQDCVFGLIIEGPQLYRVLAYANAPGGWAPAEGIPNPNDMINRGVAHQQSVLPPPAAPGHEWIGVPQLVIDDVPHPVEQYVVTVVERGDGADDTLALGQQRVSCGM